MQLTFCFHLCEMNGDYGHNIAMCQFAAKYYGCASSNSDFFLIQ